jgi:hypothetical protein
MKSFHWLAKYHGSRGDIECQPVLVQPNQELVQTPFRQAADHAGVRFAVAHHFRRRRCVSVALGAAHGDRSVAFGRIGSIVGPKLGGTLKAAGHGPSQLLMDLLPIVIIGSVRALWLAWELGRGDHEGVERQGA